MIPNDLHLALDCPGILLVRWPAAALEAVPHQPRQHSLQRIPAGAHQFRYSRCGLYEEVEVYRTGPGEDERWQAKIGKGLHPFVAQRRNLVVAEEERSFAGKSAPCSVRSAN